MTSLNRSIEHRIMMLQLLVRDFVNTAETRGERFGKHSVSEFNFDLAELLRRLYP